MFKKFLIVIINWLRRGYSQEEVIGKGEEARFSA